MCPKQQNSKTAKQQNSKTAKQQNSNITTPARAPYFFHFVLKNHKIWLTSYTNGMQQKQVPSGHIRKNSTLRLTASGSTTLQGTFKKTGSFANRRWLSTTTSKLALASLLLTIFTACPSSSSSSSPGPVAPALSGDYAFTYNTQASLMISNSGGAVGSYELASGSTLPTGLALDIKDGQLFVEGTPTKVTLNTAKAQIAAVPLQISVTGSGGTTMAMVNVTVNPKFVTGDQSMGITHVVASATTDHTHSHRGSSVTHQHAGPPANSPLIHVANNISFASGGTGAVTDPVLIGVASGATSLSFVVDFNNVMIPNFDATSNDTFLIQLIGIPVGATIASVGLEYMEALDTNSQIRFPHFHHPILL